MWQSKYVDWAVLSLGSLINIFKNSFCTLPHDKIYAFLGLANDHFDNPIFVGYEKSLYEVYQDAVEFYYTAPVLELTENLLNWSLQWFSSSLAHSGGNTPSKK
jgi:hypothetical protein